MWNKIGGQVDLPARTRSGLAFWTASFVFCHAPHSALIATNVNIFVFRSSEMKNPVRL
jgi:hypothetical protein